MLSPARGRGVGRVFQLRGGLHSGHSRGEDYRQRDDQHRHRRSQRDTRWAARRYHVEHHHLVLRHSVEFVPRAYWWLCGRRHRESGMGGDHVGAQMDRDAVVHRDLSVRRVARGIYVDGGDLLDIAQGAPGAGEIVSEGCSCSVQRCSRWHTAGTMHRRRWGSLSGCSLSVQPLTATQTGIWHHLYIADANTVPLWVEVSAYTAISLGTLFGGWRIVATMGSRITKLRPVGGFAAETGGAFAILIATRFGIPVSTTHTITGSIVGVGAANRISAVRWGLAGRIVWAWIITIPAAGVMAAVAFWLLNAVIKL